MSETHDSKRVAKNTLALFFRMAFLMLIALYTSRVILKALGVNDFGVYNVVGGFVSMFAIISSSLSASISRYLTFALGKGDKEQLSRIFSTSVTMLYLMCALLLVLLETFGIWFVNFKLNIPDGRMVAANWVFQFSVITFLIDLMAMPYNAIVMSHERMTAYAYISIYEGLGKLAVAFLVMVSPIDRLIFYAALMALVAVSVRVIYTVYCRHHFPESHYHFVWDKQLMKSMSSFSGWTFFGIVSSMFADQGVNMALNMFIGPAVNAARGIAGQVSQGVGSLCGSFTSAVGPQLTKSFAAGEREYYLRLLDRGTRYSSYLYQIIAIPVIITAPYILEIWLGTVPDHTVNFVRIVLSTSLLTMGSWYLLTLILAAGEIKKFQVIEGLLWMLQLPLCWFLLKFGLQPESVYFSSLFISVLDLILRISFAKIKFNLPVKQFIKKSILRVAVIEALSFVVPFALYELIGNTLLLKFILVCLVSIISSLLFIYLLGMDHSERLFFINKLKNYMCIVMNRTSKQ